MIFVVVAVFNRREHTRRFLEAMRAQSEPHRTLVVDDGSTDGTAEMIRESFPDVRVIRTERELWWTGSMREGVDAVLPDAGPGDFVVCANNDQIPGPAALKTLRETSEREERAIVGSVSKSREDPSKVYDAAFAWDARRDKYTRVALKPSGVITEGIDVLTCRLTIVPVEVFKRATFRPEFFPHYLGDHDFFLEAKRAGFQLLLSCDAELYDMGGPSGSYRAGWNIGFRELWNNLFSLRSPRNIRYNTRFYLMHSPNPLHRAAHLAYVFAKVGVRFGVVFFGTPIRWVRNSVTAGRR